MLFAWREAAYYYTAALSAAETSGCLAPQQRAELHYRAGLASYWDGNMGRCLDHYDQAIKIYRLTNDIRGLAQVLIKKIYLTAVGSYGGQIDVQPLEAVLEMLGQDDLRLCAHLIMAMAEIYWIARQPNKAEVMAQRALEIGKHCHDDEICSRASFDLAMAQNQSLRVQEALESYERTRQYAQRARNLWFESWPLQRMPTVLFHLGRFDEATLVAQEAREFASKANNWGHYSLTTGTLTCMAVARGDFAAAERYAKETMDLLLQYRFPYGGALALPAMACAYMLRGTRVEAERALNTLMEPGRVFENPEPSFGPITHVYRQLIRLQVDTNADIASPTVTHLLNMIGTERFDVTSLAPYCALIELSTCEVASDAMTYLYTQLATALGQGILFSRGWIFLLPRILGVAATINQQWEIAERHFQEAINIATRVGASPELGLTWLNYAHMLAKRGAQRDLYNAADLLHKATPVLQELHMISFARRAARLSDTLAEYGSTSL
jgi:tetratricopeptide (TPR) repeat protein